MSLEIISASAFVGVTGLALAAAHWLGSKDKRVEGRVSGLRDVAGREPGEKRTDGARPSRMLGRTIPRFAKHLLPDDERKRTRLEARLVHAGIHRPSALYLYLIARTVLMVAPGMVGLFLVGIGTCTLQTGVLYGGLGSLTGYLAPGYWLDRRKARRHIRLNRSLPDFLDLLVTCMESGLSLEASLQRVTKELSVAHAELAAEMERVQQEIELGATPDVALANFAERVDLDDVGMLATFVQQARRFGTSIGEALRVQAESLRLSREERAEELAQKASVKILFPTLLFIFPAVFVVLAGPAAIQLWQTFGGESQSSPLNEETP